MPLSIRSYIPHTALSPSVIEYLVLMELGQKCFLGFTLCSFHYAEVWPCDTLLLTLQIPSAF